MDALSPFNSPAYAYVALGSNVGDRQQLLLQAIQQLSGRPDIEVLRVSGVYETDPVGYTDQPPFLNMAIAVRTTLSPLALLHVLLDTEQQLGRVRDIRWGPRTIDLDLLLYADVVMDGEELTLPHPRMMERSFVLVPLGDVIEQSHPLKEQVAAAAASALQDGKEGIMLWKIINWHSESGHFVS
ncbi:2-amino-4-hydroxy-6-hydroxymethyldihydropteridinediphosphokinase [Paenibacillus algorifonticola]|uniref:2-amino-4-hydroxy-6-hydroxymethyldihydropteridine diphosphokinase n=1 Tax=Paenibacillus algorifonticola TaxID=684063 RepID=A0A1I2ILZ1_9BACL|nr:2-amino-4-hydroxy-6-hydroxymethyldihydropteridine diphosphokinase [Paenibacillus algorifonticola]SFF43359.1 2-amino-4-hydroxy-6-hydroxymethyldihydropteridinediphosphokinase [Paenibacillus algorifonticola]